ncbi:EAL domain-containing protein [Christensenellaceae bacterium NSJ-44]|uniref:EAL domain-containing protein n=1 Tax=Luoshenia tenuis TaxID=2763654 RepID=A0A926D248_9FIRM|nr:EAL domain-containing protein [Luoshenia tenuis]MBC8529962.1 EAL domain-containing protein [Luoshenia tenuis]
MGLGKGGSQAAGFGGFRRILFTKWHKILLLFVLVAAVSGLMIWNALGLGQAVDRRTEVYVSDVSTQLAGDIDYRLGKNILDLTLMEDGLLTSLGDPSENNNELEAYLEGRAALLGFNKIVITLKEEQPLGSALVDQSVAGYPGVQAALEGENGVSFLDQQSLLYSVPLHDGDEIIGALSGVRDKANMQRLIQPSSFSGSGLTCIINHQGEVIISPTELDVFMQLESIFQDGAGGQTAQHIHQMEENMKSGQSGVFSFTAVDGTRLVLSYQPLHSYNWVLLTLVPADIISRETDQYIHQSFIIVTAAVLVLVVLVVLLLKNYQTHYRKLERIAFVDPVTGGMNGPAFSLRCGELIGAAPPDSYCVVALNISDLTLINESFGSVERDRTLRYVMQVLQGAVTQDEAAAYAARDYFFLCLRESNPENISRRLAELVQRINAFNADLREPYYLRIQQGVYIVEEPGQDTTIIRDRALTACRNHLPDSQEVCAFYDQALTQMLQREHELNVLFEAALANEEFEVYLQPKVSLTDGHVHGAEALVRWVRSKQGTIFPSDFIPVFERNGKICQLDFYVFEQVCKTLRRWLDEGRAPMVVSVNLSRQHFKNPDFLQAYAQTARQYGIPEGVIEFELTESIFFDDQGIAHVKEQIGQMHRLGFGCSLDDFGAGYSSLGLLMEFDVDVIKLDRRFFTSVDNPKTRKVVDAIVSLARELKMDTVAEGIETQEQLEFLRQVHCDRVQGYIYSRPLPIPEFEAWLDGRGKDTETRN